MTLLGTRPEIIKLSEVMKELDRHFEHILVHTGQNHDYELNEVFFKDLGLRAPDHFLDVASDTAILTIARILERVDEVLAREQPDALLVLGDTNSALGAYVAKRRKIPIFHMEAGNRCFDARVPEEINRSIVDHLSDINIVYSDVARQNLMREGFPVDRILKSGSPLFEVLRAHSIAINQSCILKELGLVSGEYFVLSVHREENIVPVDSFARMVETVKRVAELYKKPIIFSVHPRTRKRLDEEHIEFPSEVRVLRPFGFFDYVALEKNATCVLSDSGTLSEEASILGFPSVMLRETHERLEGMDAAVAIMAGLNPDRVLQAIALATTGERRTGIVPDYAVPDVSVRIVRDIMSYIDYVNRVVWRRT